MMRSRQQPAWQVTRTIRSRARSLRRDSTDAERLIWSALRAHRLNSASFRRQTPVGPCIAGFLCYSAKLIVEVDGGQHFDAKHQKQDARRNAFLASRGDRVLRFNNHDVMPGRAGVLEAIAAALNRAPSPPLPRKRGERAAASGEAR